MEINMKYTLFGTLGEDFNGVIEHAQKNSKHRKMHGRNSTLQGAF